MATTLPVFHEWRDKSLDDALLECCYMVESPDFETVARWRESGGKVVGHFQVAFPEEVVHAAGMLPFKMRGAPLEPNLADSRFGSYLCSILKTSLELVLDERIHLDMFVSHPICDTARNLATIWGRNFDYPCQILYLPQNPNSAGSVEYLRHEYDRMRKIAEDVSGRAITDAATEVRRQLETPYSMRRPERARAITNCWICSVPSKMS
ncbi:MAG: 2-hydroxyacyl-CoA dehydratase [Acidimicrobiia bacterium]|nr:2-hydroxyacyl-CoA dehydratase [Actinomycetota bacterium]MBL6924680.1 2-hydroxyacyl-CoA dehydratase [Acidimicrobiia bacterium]MBL6926419.1 2-hydroxyacyl-CoA dehydratase [Acidimicrobiia bacterium]